jgi:hypothetical protein
VRQSLDSEQGHGYGYLFRRARCFVEGVVASHFHPIHDPSITSTPSTFELQLCIQPSRVPVTPHHTSHIIHQTSTLLTAIARHHNHHQSTFFPPQPCFGFWGEVTRLELAYKLQLQAYRSSPSFPSCGFLPFPAPPRSADGKKGDTAGLRAL